MPSEDMPITYLTHKDLQEMLSIDPDAIVFVINTVTEKPYKLKLKTLVEGLSAVTSFDIDGGSFI